jgi:hypothetical protein
MKKKINAKREKCMKTGHDEKCTPLEEKSMYGVVNLQVTRTVDLL